MRINKKIGFSAALVAAIVGALVLTSSPDTEDTSTHPASSKPFPISATSVIGLTPGVPFDWTQVNPGDTVRVTSGTYTDMSINVGIGGTIDNRIILDGTGVTLIGGHISVSVGDTEFDDQGGGPQLRVSKNYVTVRNFNMLNPTKVGGQGRGCVWFGSTTWPTRVIGLVIENMTLNSETFGTGIDSRAILDGPNTWAWEDLIIQNCDIRNFSANAINLGGVGNNILIENNKMINIFGIDPVHMEHIHLRGTLNGVRVTRNYFGQTIQTATEIAISISNDVQNISIDNNVFVDIANPITFHPNNTMGPISLIHNTFFKCGNMIVYQGQIGITSINNIFASSTFKPWGFINVPGGSGAGNGADMLISDHHNAYGDGNNITNVFDVLVDPNPFVNSASDNFHLIQFSNAISAGDGAVDSKFDMDFNGNIHDPFNPNMGAFASVLSVLPITPTATPIPSAASNWEMYD